MVPTVHANWRYFEMYDENGKVIEWFGGGQDLTPIICLKKMQLIFIKLVKPLVTNTILSFIQNIKSNVMPISGTHIAMKPVE
jgi:coproporphyrinogen III oxidase